jgi:hypothetical protein
VRCFLCGTDWVLKCYLDGLRTSNVTFCSRETVRVWCAVTHYVPAVDLRNPRDGLCLEANRLWYWTQLTGEGPDVFWYLLLLMIVTAYNGRSHSSCHLHWIGWCSVQMALDARDGREVLVGTNVGQSKVTSPNLDQECRDLTLMYTGPVWLLSVVYYKFFTRKTWDKRVMWKPFLSFQTHVLSPKLISRFC